MAPVPSSLIRLCHRRWNLPALAALERAGGGAKLVWLVHVLGAARGPLSASLTHLGSLGLVKRNPGYGHPMRPEYLLTPRGTAVATWSRDVLASVEVTARGALLRKWSLPVLFAVEGGLDRFTDVRDAIRALTPRALALTLKQLTAAGLLARDVYDAQPPLIEYRISARGYRLARRLATYSDLGLPG